MSNKQNQVGKLEKQGNDDLAKKVDEIVEWINNQNSESLPEELNTNGILYVIEGGKTLIKVEREDI